MYFIISFLNLKTEPPGLAVLRVARGVSGSTYNTPLLPPLPVRRERSASQGRERGTIGQLKTLSRALEPDLSRSTGRGDFFALRVNLAQSFEAWRPTAAAKSPAPCRSSRT